MFAVLFFLKVTYSEIKKNNKAEYISDKKIFLLCISSVAIGFGLISILPYEIPLFLRVSIAFLFLGIPLLDIKKTVLFGIVGGLGFFIKDFILWDLFSFRWTTEYGSNATDISVLAGLMIGTFLGIVLWDKKAIGIFALTGALAFFLGSTLGAGLVFSAGMCFYLLSLKKTTSSLRSLIFICAIIYLFIFGIIMILGRTGMIEHPNYAGNVVVSIGEVVEKEGTSIAIKNYTFIQNNTGKDLKASMMIQNTDNVNGLRLHLWYKYEGLGGEITGIPVGVSPAPGEILKIPVGHLVATGANTTDYYLSFENLPVGLRTRDLAVVWEVWTSKGIEYVIWRSK